MTRVAVIISTFNRAKHFLPRAIESVLAQTYRDWTLWIVDDCSRDGTSQVVAAFMARDERVNYVCMPQPSGYQCGPKNLGIRSSESELIAYLDDDNEWLPNHLEVLVRALDAEQADLVYAGREYRNDDTFPHPECPCIGTFQEHNNQAWEPARLQFENWIDTSDILHTRALAVKLGGWNELVRRAADWDLMKRVALADFKVIHVPEVLTVYYWHEANIGQLPIGRPAVWTLTKNRLWFVQRMLSALRTMTNIGFDHYVLDQGSTDGAADFLAEQYRAGQLAYLRLEPTNIGISRGSNHLLDIIEAAQMHAWVVKLDSDVMVQTPNWLERMIQRSRPRHVLSPHVLGLVDHPGGAPRTHTDVQARLGYAKHLGGACNVAPAGGWHDFGRWITPGPAHGTQDAEFSARMRDKGYRLAYVEDVLVRHLGNVDAETRAAERGLVV